MTRSWVVRTDGTPVSLWRIGVYCVYGIAGLSFTVFPLMSFLYLIPEAKGTRVDRALVGIAFSAIMFFPAFIFAAPLSTKDRKLFSTTPLTPRPYYKRLLIFAAPLYGCVLAIGPAVAPIVCALIPPEEIQRGFRWSPVMVAESLTAYYAFLLGPAALVVAVMRLETPGLFPAGITNVRRNRRIGVAICAVALLAMFYRRELLAALSSVVEFALNQGTPGVVALGFISPASVLAIQGRQALPPMAPPLLLLLWTMTILFEIQVLWTRMRRERPRHEIADVVARGDMMLPKRQPISSSPVAADLFRVHLISMMDVGEESREYDCSGSPERRYVRLLPYTQYAPIGLGPVKNLIVLAYRWPWLVLVFVVWVVSASDPLFEQKPATLPPMIMFASIYVNIYSGIRWTWPLRSSLSLPLRLNRLAVDTWKARWVYFFVCDAAVAGLALFVDDSGALGALLMFVVLQLARFCGQIRSCLSIFYGAGRKRGSWLFEAPLLLAPLELLTIYVISTFWNWIPVALVGCLFILFWPLYGLGIAWWCYLDNDWSLPRASNSYRPGVPSSESV